MTEDDLRAAHRLSQAVGWPHRLQDWEFAFRSGSGFVAEGGAAVVGTGLCWLQGDQHASLGMIIVSPERQGEGIGRELMTRLLAELCDRCTVLHATLAGQPLYQRLGFVPVETVLQHQGTILGAAPATLAPGERLRPVEFGDFGELATLAERAAGMPRGHLLRHLLECADGVLLERERKPIGFSFIRRFGRGHVIGPVAAPDRERARALIGHWAPAYAGSFVRVDVIDAGGLSSWLATIGLVQVDTVIRMVRGPAIASDIAVTQFAIFNQALG